MLNDFCCSSAANIARTVFGRDGKSSAFFCAGIFTEYVPLEEALADPSVLLSFIFRHHF
jgi:hypothetical protein